MTTKTTKSTKAIKPNTISKQDEIQIRLASVQLQTSHNKIDIDAISENVEIIAERLNVLYWIATFAVALSVVAFFAAFITKH
jgi:hypothetical protein